MKAFIFDLDGTLLNTLADIAAACNHTLAERNFPGHEIAAYARMVGNGFTTLAQRALPANASLTPQKLDAFVAEARDYYAAHMMEETDPYPGMTGALSSLMHAGAILAVLSNKPQRLSEELVNHYFPSIRFAAVWGARPDKPLKPDPSSLLEMLRDFGLAQKDAAYVGDSDVDILTARNAGTLAVGAAWGFRGAKELETAGADIIIGNPWELAEVAHVVL